MFNSAFNDFIKDTLLFPIFIYPKVRDLPFPKFQLDNLIFYFPIFIFLLTGFNLYIYLKRKNKDIYLWLISFLSLFLLYLFFYSSLRADIEHLLSTLTLVIILFFVVLNNLFKRSFDADKNNIKKITAHLACFLTVILLIFPGMIKFNNLPPKYSIKNHSICMHSRAIGMYCDNSEFSHSQNQVIQYIQKNTKPNDKIFVGNLRHDKIVYNDIIFYFFSDRNCAIRYHELHPGLINTNEVQREIINKFRQIYVPYVILWEGAEEINEPNASSKSSGALDFDNFIKTNYKIEKKFGSYMILRHI
ncbi:MAG: hypothetical protein ABIH18_06990 [Candidatus Omnitrophota bacterium]